MNTSYNEEKGNRASNDREILQDFAAFIRTSRLNEFIEKEIGYFLSFNLPLLQYVAHFSDEEKFQITKRSGERFLLALENNQCEALIQDNFLRWESDQIKFIGKDQISLEDILLINSGQKLALLHFVPQFTNNPSHILDIAGKLELIYQKAQLTTIAMLEKKRKDEELKFRESEERYKDLFDNASDLIHLVTAEGKIMYVNKAWKQTLGYTEEELKGESIYFFICSKDRERFRKYRNNILEGHDSNEVISISFLSKNNTEIITEGAVSSKRINGQPQYTRGIFRDTTRRVQNEEKLQFYTQQVMEREGRIKHLVESAPDAIIVINAAGIITVWNPKAAETFGWTAEEVMGNSLSETIIPPAYREAHNKGMKRLLETGEARVLNKTIEVTALKKDGTEFYVSLTISKANIPGETLFIAFLRDISTEKKNQIELEKHRIQLEKTNAELEQYAWVVSHDLKEPLRKIRTFSDILLHNSEDPIPPNTLIKLQKIHQSAERMDNLIEAILMYSHSSADDPFEEVDLNDIVREVLSDLELTISAKQANIYSDTLPVINGIAFQLRQLFQNLISNALKYNKPGIIPEIRISYHNETDHHRIIVTDNGIGFKEEFSVKIFQVFHRLVSKQEYEGTGIGLALCKKIVENHGGSISATSKEGLTAAFEILLPHNAPVS